MLTEAPIFCLMIWTFQEQKGHLPSIPKYSTQNFGNKFLYYLCYIYVLLFTKNILFGIRIVA